MNLLSIAHSLPKSCYSQSEIWQLLKSSPQVAALRPRALGLLEKVLSGPGGIATRHFATAEPGRLFPMHPGELSRYFEESAPPLAAAALENALARAGLEAAEVDALFLCTCTGYLCPGPTSHVAELAGMREDVFLLDIVGAGCGAAIPTMRAAAGWLAAHPDKKAAVIAVEVCSAAFFLHEDPAVLISLCLFGDAASASIWTGRAAAGSLGRLGDFRSIHRPDHREKIRFSNHDGYLRNQLDRTVPALAAGAVSGMVAGQLAPDARLICHPGGRDVLDAIEQAVPGQPQTASRAVLSRAGNCSSPSVLMALEHDLASAGATAGDRILTSFGAGFSCHTARFTPVEKD